MLTVGVKIQILVLKPLPPVWGPLNICGKLGATRGIFCGLLKDRFGLAFLHVPQFPHIHPISIQSIFLRYFGKSSIIPNPLLSPLGPGVLLKIQPPCPSGSTNTINASQLGRPMFSRHRPLLPTIMSNKMAGRV